MKKFSKCMAVVATLSLVFSLFFACKQSSDDGDDSTGEIQTISIKPVDSEKVYIVGESLSKDDFIVTVTYSDGASERLTEGVEFTGLENLKSGAVTITAKYGNFDASCEIIVISSNDLKYDEEKDGEGNTIRLTGITLFLKDSEKTFVEGGSISKSDFIVTAEYDDGSIKAVSEGVVFAGLGGSLSAGFVTIKAQYGSASASFRIPVAKKNSEYDEIKGENGSTIKLAGISLALKDESKKFVEGDKVSKDDLVVKAKYNDGSSKTVTDGVEFQGIDEDLNAGTVKILALYGSASTSLDINVSANPELVKLEGVSLAPKENKTFVEGESISASDFTVTAKYSNGTTKTVTVADGVKFTGLVEAASAGEVLIGVTYSSGGVSKSAYITVTVYENASDVGVLESISIALKENKTFVVGDTISASDFVVTAKYSDGKTKTMTETDGVKFTKGLGEAKAGDITVVVTYLTKTAFKTITVVEKPVIDDPELPNALYIVGYFSDWDISSAIPMSKNGNCFYYEFEKSGAIGFEIYTSRSWSKQVFGGVTIPLTGVYVANKNNSMNYGSAEINIANPGDRIYVRYKDGTYYVRYAAKGEPVNPNEEMEIVPAIEFDVWGLPSYAFENESYAINIAKDENILCNYTYQWYLYNSDVADQPINGATSKDSPKFEQGYSYYCAVTATAIENKKNKVTKATFPCYIDNAEITVSFLESEVTFAEGENSKELMAQISTNWYDEIKWNSSAPLVAAVDANGNTASIRAIGNGEAIITVTVVRRGEEKSVTCKVVVGNVKSVWWYYVLDTSKASETPVDFLNFIFNLGDGAAQTADIEDVQSTGEIAYRWNGIQYGIGNIQGAGGENSVFEKIDVDESVRQNGLNIENNLVVYLCMPEGYSPIYIYSWIKVKVEYSDENGESYNSIESRDLTKSWPGDPMILCEVNDTNFTE